MRLKSGQTLLGPNPAGLSRLSIQRVEKGRTETRHEIHGLDLKGMEGHSRVHEKLSGRCFHGFRSV